MGKEEPSQDSYTEDEETELKEGITVPFLELYDSDNNQRLI